MFVLRSLQVVSLACSEGGSRRPVSLWVSSGRAFFLTAVVYTNANGILNDDAYEYDEIAHPFLEALAEACCLELGFTD